MSARRLVALLSHRILARVRKPCVSLSSISHSVVIVLVRVSAFYFLIRDNIFY